MELGFKVLTVQNFREVDEMMRGFVTVDARAGTRPISEEEWAAEILSISLLDVVPAEVHGLFAVARGAMLYGCFFYPLFTLASEQLLRAGEASVTLRCRALDAPAAVKSFFDRIRWLRERAVLTEETESLWHSVRKLRNDASHPTYQMIVLPGMAIGLLERMAAEINNCWSPRVS